MSDGVADDDAADQGADAAANSWLSAADRHAAFAVINEASRLYEEPFDVVSGAAVRPRCGFAFA